jgi:hypothetical protein
MRTLLTIVKRETTKATIVVTITTVIANNILI